MSFTLPDGTRTGRVLARGSDWQIFTTSAGGSALAVLPELHRRWVEDGFIGENLFASCEADGTAFFVLASKKGYITSSVQQGPYPTDSTEVRAFAAALREARKIAGNTSRRT